LLQSDMIHAIPSLSHQIREEEKGRYSYMEKEETANLG